MRAAGEVPTPEPVPGYNPDPQPGDPKPKAPPPAEDERGPQAPIELPGRPGALPERLLWQELWQEIRPEPASLLGRQLSKQ